MPTAELTKEEHQAHAGLTRDYEATCSQKYSTTTDEQFRSSTGNKLLAQIPDMDIAHIRRCYEANCGLGYPKPFDLVIRLELQKALGKHHGLRSFRSTPQPKKA